MLVIRNGCVSPQQPLLLHHAMLICKYRITLVLNESEHSWDDRDDQLSDLYTISIYHPPAQ